MKYMMAAAATVLAVTLAILAAVAQQPTADGPRYTAAGELVRPADYREWVYLSTGLNMTYDANAPNEGDGNATADTRTARSGSVIVTLCVNASSCVLST